MTAQILFVFEICRFSFKKTSKKLIKFEFPNSLGGVLSSYTQGRKILPPNINAHRLLISEKAFFIFLIF